MQETDCNCKNAPISFYENTIKVINHEVRTSKKNSAPTG